MAYSAANATMLPPGAGGGMWWLLNLHYPEGVKDVLQIFAADAKQARDVADTWLKQAGIVSKNEQFTIEVRDSSANPFSNQVITSNGLQSPPASSAPPVTPPAVTPPPVKTPVKPPSTLQGPPELNSQLPPGDQLKAQILRGLAMQLHQGAGDLQNSIAGRGALDRSGDYANVFRFQNQLAGNPAGSQADPMALQSFTANTSPQGLSQEALRAFRILSGQDANAVPGAQTATWQQTYKQPTGESAGYLASLAAQALQNRYSPLALQNLNMPSGEDLRNRWLATTGGGPNADFIQYVRDNYPLLAGL